MNRSAGPPGNGNRSNRAKEGAAKRQANVNGEDSHELGVLQLTGQSHPLLVAYKSWLVRAV